MAEPAPVTASPPRRPLQGITVVEIGGGAAAGYCGRLLADAGATVHVAARSEDQRRAGIVRSDHPAEHAYAAYLAAGKLIVPADLQPPDLAALCRDADLVLVGEAAAFDARAVRPRVATVALSWFGTNGPYAGWQGSDLTVQALLGTPHMAGTIDGPPLHHGDRQATTIAGVTAFIASCAALLAPASARTRRYDISIFEANVVLAEMHMHFFQRDGVPMKRWGLNRFAPNSPVGIYPCRGGWVGITVSTPDQWRALCAALDLREQAADTGLATRELRFARIDEVEAVLCRALAHRTAEEWAAVGRQHRLPLVVVPDAEGILRHPIFGDRQALATLPHGPATLQVPRSPLTLTRTPLAQHLAPAMATSRPVATPAPADSAPEEDAPAPPPLQGLTLVDFSMGWAGPLASRLMADLGATVLKIEAARYPDWWRGMNWTPEFIAEQQYEKSTIYCGLNRGKRGISLDLTVPAGRELALQLIAGADAVIENQAAGVMARFGLDFQQVANARPDAVMVSMSAFGLGNAWSDTRAYGSTLEQGSGLPSFVGLPGTPPTMTHLAHGDPVGGLYGCAALLAALVHRQRTGQGQFVNQSMVESMLQFTTPALLEHQVTGTSPRRGNRHASLVPQGVFAAAGADQWVALSVHDGPAFARLARLLDRPDWAENTALQALAERRRIEDQIDAALSSWIAMRQPHDAAQALQAAGIAATPLRHAQDLTSDPHLQARGFFIDLQRPLSGPQRQAGTSIVLDGQRLGAQQPAPLLGEHSWVELHLRTEMDRLRYDGLVQAGVIGLTPRPARNLVAPSQT